MAILLISDINFNDELVNIEYDESGGIKYYLLNLLYIHNKCNIKENTLVPYCKEIIEKYNDFKFYFTYEKIDSIIFKLKDKELESKIDYNILIYINIRVWQVFNFIYKEYLIRYPIYQPIVYDYINTLKDINNKLIIRIGIVELQAVNVFLFCNKNYIYNAIKNIMNEYNNEKYLYTHIKTSWVSYFDNENDV